MKRRFGVVAFAVGASVAAGLVAVPEAGAVGSLPFSMLEAPFTQELVGVVSQPSRLATGVAFASDGDILVSECFGLQFGSLRRFDVASTKPPVRGTSTLHPESSSPGLVGCGLVNGVSGAVFSNTPSGVTKLDPATGALIAGPFGPAGDSLGIAVDPVTGDLVYAGGDGALYRVNEAMTSSSRFAASLGQYTDGLYFDPTGLFVFVALSGGLGVINRSGQTVQFIPMSHQPDGVAFRSKAPSFVVTNNTDGTISKLVFPSSDYTKSPTVTNLATGGFRGDLTQVGPDRCLYVTQAGTRYDDGSTTSENSIVQICPSFQPPPGSDSNVVVALGDSYQSGEGAAYRFADRGTYLAQGYETGLNYAQLSGEKDQTLTGNMTRELFGSRPGPGYESESCHRALQNYVKLDARQLNVAKPLVLFDRTCSGATISNSPDAGPNAKPPIIGPIGGPVDPRSQLSQILRRLDAAGLTPADVDYVTVGMGGNDAKFGGIVGACVAPTLIREALRNVPNAPGEAKALAALATCGRIDGYLVKSADAIKQLQQTEEWAQSLLLTTFPNATIYQLNYPGILPSKKDAPEYCAGVSKADIDYANKKLPQISKAISKSINTNASAFGGRIKLVDVSTVFGKNPLCPPNAADELANGFRQDKLQAAISALLNDPEFRPLLDRLIVAYKAERDCLKTIIGPAFGLCDSQKLADDLAAAWRNVAKFMNPVADPSNPQLKPADRLVASMAAYSSPGDSDFLLFDRSRGFFHPNDQGFRTDSCALLAVHQNLPSTSGCTYVPRPASPTTVNGTAVSRNPTSVAPRSTVTYTASGYVPGSTVKVVARSTPIELATHTADLNGNISGSVPLPELEPGLHSLELQGTTESGNQLIQGTQLKILGAPRMGQTYVDYACCFLPADDSVEATDDTVEIWVNGTLSSTESPDADGGISFAIPIVTDPTNVELRLNGIAPGRIITYTNLVGCRLCLQAPTSSSVSLRGNASVTVNGTVAVASTDPASIRLTGSASLDATGASASIVSQGGTSLNGAARTTPTVLHGTLPNAQAILTALRTPAASTPNCTFGPTGASCTTPVPGAVLTPGNYRLPIGDYGTVNLVGSVGLRIDGGSITNLTASGASAIDLQPGSIQIERLALSGSSTLTGLGTFMRIGCLTSNCTGGKVELSGNSSVALRYTTVPKDAGFAATTTNPNTITLAGSASFTVDANIAAPNVVVALSGSARVRAPGREIVIGSIDAAGTARLDVQ